MPPIKIVADIIHFDGYPIAQIDTNTPTSVRDAFERTLNGLTNQESYEDGYDEGYDTGYRNAET
jgi:hypothetical protein